MPAKKEPPGKVIPLDAPGRKRIGSDGKARRARSATPRQAAAGRKNLEAGHIAKSAKKAAVGPKRKGEKSRMQQLIDGEITVRDLDEEELYRMQCRDRLGEFGGRPPQISAKLAREMKAEAIRRGQSIIDANISKASALLGKVLDSPAATMKDKIKAAEVLLARGMGSVPQHVVNHEGTKWDDMLDGDDAVVIMYDDNKEGTG